MSQYLVESSLNNAENKASQKKRPGSCTHIPFAIPETDLIPSCDASHALSAWLQTNTTAGHKCDITKRGLDQPTKLEGRRMCVQACPGLPMTIVLHNLVDFWGGMCSGLRLNRRGSRRGPDFIAQGRIACLGPGRDEFSESVVLFSSSWAPVEFVAMPLNNPPVRRCTGTRPHLAFERFRSGKIT